MIKSRRLGEYSEKTVRISTAMTSTRSLQDIPKPQLARDVSSIVFCYLTPLLVGASQDAWQQVKPLGLVSTTHRFA